MFSKKSRKLLSNWSSRIQFEHSIARDASHAICRLYIQAANVNNSKFEFEFCTSLVFILCFELLQYSFEFVFILIFWKTKTSQNRRLWLFSVRVSLLENHEFGVWTIRLINANGFRCLLSLKLSERERFIKFASCQNRRALYRLLAIQ